MTGGLTDEVRLLVRLSAALAARGDDELDAQLRAAAQGVDAVRVEEALLQSYLFLGYPVALNAIARWREVSGVPAPADHAADQDEWRARGERVCSTVYGGQYEGLRANVRGLHPDMERWMVEEGYGKVLGRPGLDLVERELCIVAMLAVLDAPRQLYSHLRGALNAGAPAEAVTEALDLALLFASAPVAGQARSTWDAVRARGGN